MKFQRYFKLRILTDSPVPGVYDSEIRRFYRYVARIAKTPDKTRKLRVIKRRILSSRRE
jgi:hypothetical protein